VLHFHRLSPLVFKHSILNLLQACRSGRLALPGLLFNISFMYIKNFSQFASNKMHLIIC
jgi:hypothetical protein